LPGAQTISASILARLGRPFLSAKREGAVVAQFVQRLGIKLTSPTQLARTLSGGNQQKAALPRRSPRCRGSSFSTSRRVASTRKRVRTSIG